MNFRDLLRQAYRYGDEFSHDTSTKLGAMLVKPDTRLLVEVGTNRYLTKEMRGDPKNHERPRKYAFIEHAERDVIFKAWRQGFITQGLTMIAPWACCGDCARAIVYAGISTVVTHKQAYDRSPERWRESIEHGREILAGGGVDYCQWDGEVGGVVNLFDGETWQP